MLIPYGKKCIVCGGSNGRATSDYCSRTCMRRAFKRRKIGWPIADVERACGVCGGIFTAGTGKGNPATAEYCGHECARAAFWRRQVARTPSRPIAGQCLQCGEAFWGPRNKIYCSARCSHRHFLQNPPESWVIYERTRLRERLKERRKDPEWRERARVRYRVADEAHPERVVRRNRASIRAAHRVEAIYDAAIELFPRLKGLEPPYFSRGRRRLQLSLADECMLGVARAARNFFNARVSANRYDGPAKRQAAAEVAAWSEIVAEIESRGQLPPSNPQRRRNAMRRHRRAVVPAIIEMFPQLKDLAA